ncbi:hypothetical protein HFN_1921 [Helicobacter fennelliae MRY12-0050]|uniref:Uncharacterized protein n=1 Tax=Helicobacter fennelliae MRY12-0050 TaxID=1325130 RepID=T1DUZ9_9HELI|nr:hypothetical protein HFN_1921 [Helicobacter fennelliae MRY12-0050]
MKHFRVCDFNINLLYAKLIYNGFLCFIKNLDSNFYRF